VQILGEGKVEAIEVVHNELVEENGALKAVSTGHTEVIPCGIVLRSVGYRGVELPGVPFDERRGVIPNEHGRVTGCPGVYAAGWIKRGPSGVIGTNKKDAAETVESLLADARAGLLSNEGGELEELLRERGVEFVEYAGWQAIDAHEREGGERKGRPRVKLTSWDELLARARSLKSNV
jgi:ferredoxin--NADP+ reductase